MSVKNIQRTFQDKQNLQEATKNDFKTYKNLQKLQETYKDLSKLMITYLELNLNLTWS